VPSPRLCTLALLTCALLLADAARAAAPSAPREIRAVVVTMFESGEVTGDRPGELQFWVERWPLVERLDFPAGEFPLYLSEDGVLAVCTGGGIPNATASIMALGLDPRFDLSKAYWLVAGIAGGDPEDTSLGSAVWAKHVVDGDLLYEIDAREIPESWPWGLIPLGADEPAASSEDIYTGWTVDTIHFALNEELVDWAYERSRDVELDDTPAMAAFREQFDGLPAARRPPRVMLGDTLASSTYWHGERLNAWANSWVPLYAGEDAEFVTTNMEDSGTLTALGRLGRIGRADPDRVLVLRTISNFSMPPPGESAAWSTTADYPDDGLPAKEAAFRVGSRVIRALLADWAHFAATPSAP
jgi:purine nucleoside permease